MEVNVGGVDRTVRIILGIVLLCFFPEIALWLPNHVYKGH